MKARLSWLYAKINLIRFTSESHRDIVLEAHVSLVSLLVATLVLGLGLHFLLPFLYFLPIFRLSARVKILGKIVPLSLCASIGGVIVTLQNCMIHVDYDSLSDAFTEIVQTLSALLP